MRMQKGVGTRLFVVGWIVGNGYAGSRQIKVCTQLTHCLLRDCRTNPRIRDLRRTTRINKSKYALHAKLHRIGEDACFVEFLQNTTKNIVKFDIFVRLANEIFAVIIDWVLFISERQQ